VTSTISLQVTIVGDPQGCNVSNLQLEAAGTQALPTSGFSLGVGDSPLFFNLPFYKAV